MTDWVETRHSCTAKQAIACLAQEAEKNVATRRKQIRNENIGIQPPEFHEDDDKGFLVACGLAPDKSFEKYIRFKRTDLRTIHVDGTAVTDEFDVHVAMDDQGECAVSVDGRAMEYWQVLYKALDRLLFP